MCRARTRWTRCTYYDSVPTVHLERKGTIVGEGTLHPPDVPALSGRQTGLITYNGRGNFYGSETVNVAGETERVSFTGRYAVGPNCSVSAELASSSGLNLRAAEVIVGEGVRQAVHVLIAQPGWVFVSAIDRQ